MKVLTVLVTFILSTAFIPPTAETTLTSLYESDVEWTDIETAQKHSSEDGKPIFVFFEADWCVTCKHMRSSIFPEQEIKQLLSENYHLVSIDLDSKNEIIFNGNSYTERSFARNTEFMATPTMIFIDSNGDELGRYQGFMNQETLKRLLAYVISDRFNEIPFEEFSLSGR